MWYYLVDYVADGNEYAPAIPRGVGFNLIAAPAHDARWGLFCVWAEVPLSHQVRVVPPSTALAVISAERYPPAFALARNIVAEEFDGQVVTDEMFCARYAECLRDIMRQQEGAPYVLAEAINDELGYLQSGQYYWVVRYLRGAEKVAWVSDDFHVYHNPASDFALSAAQLERLLLPFPHGT